MNNVMISYTDCKGVNYKMYVNEQVATSVRNYVIWVDVWSDELNTKIDVEELLKLGVEKVEVSKVDLENEFTLDDEALEFLENLEEILSKLD